MDLIKEAQARGYAKGVKIRYVDHAVDFVEGNYFEIAQNGDVEAYAKPPDERKCFEDNNCDTLYSASKNKWVEIVK